MNTMRSVIIGSLRKEEEDGFGSTEKNQWKLLPQKVRQNN